MLEDQKISDEEQDYGQVLFNWSFDEFPIYPRSQNWYVLAAIAVVLLLIYAVVTVNFLFGIIVIITALIIALFQRINNQVDFQITEDGILVNKRFHDYKNIENFYIIYEPPEVKTLYFELKGFFSPRIPAPLNDQDPVEIREVLRQYLEEDLDRENEPLSDQFSRLFKL